MFSYRHSFHAGNHADVLKHAVLIAVLRHMTEKEAALTVVDTHAGAGLYRLDSDQAELSGEAADGIFRLLSDKKKPLAPVPSGGAATKKIAEPLAPLLQDYLDLVGSFNPPKALRVYPGSPFVTRRLLRPHDRLKLFELHPTDSRALTANIGQLEAGRQVVVLREDGFEGMKKFLPPPSRRALVLCDPSYELKTDYGRVVVAMGDALKRFATGTYVVWYPLIARPEAHDLPKRLKTLATKAGKSWLNAAITVKSGKMPAVTAESQKRPGLPASGMFVINPPFTLKGALQIALPQLVNLLGQDRNATFTLDSGG